MKYFYIHGVGVGDGLGIDVLDDDGVGTVDEVVGQYPTKQDCVLLFGPLQLRPPSLGEGQLQFRCITWYPYPHDTEQGVTGNQPHQPPSIDNIGRKLSITLKTIQSISFY